MALEFNTIGSAFPHYPLWFSPVDPGKRVAPKKKDKCITPKEEEPSEYRWVVDVAGLAGAIGGGFFFGVPGAIVGGALLSSAAVPLRRFLAERKNPIALREELSPGAEMGVTAGASLLFGTLFVGAAGLARFVATRVGAAVATRTAVAMAERPLLLRAWYVQRGHIIFRLAAAGAMAYDLTHDKQGRWEPANFSLDTGLGFVSSIYSMNLLYSKFFGVNVFGLDATAPMSIATYQLIRAIAGAKPFDLGDFNYDEAARFRYMNEFANILQNTATYGRAYLRPDLRGAIAAERGLTASKATGTEHVSPFGWLVDNALGVLYRRMPNGFRKIIKPTVAFPVGSLMRRPPKWAGRLGPKMVRRLTVVERFRNNNDMMKPIFGPAGRVLSLAQVWGLVVPYQYYAAPSLGMKGGQWGAHRFWKFTAWPLIGNPIQSSLGGDTAVAKLVGFSVGMGMDGAITLFYNPRYQKKEWAWDLHASLARYQSAATAEERGTIANHVVEDIFNRQMTDWSLKSLVSGKGLRKFNDAYLKTFRDEVEHSTPEEKSALEQIFSSSS